MATPASVIRSVSIVMELETVLHASDAKRIISGKSKVTTSVPMIGTAVLSNVSYLYMISRGSNASANV